MFLVFCVTSLKYFVENLSEDCFQVQPNKYVVSDISQ